MDIPAFNVIEIPGIFYNINTGAPFEKCLVCDRDLLEEGVQYVIEKAIKKYPSFGSEDILFEYAICFDCAEKMRKQLSNESLNNIQNYFMQNSQMRTRAEDLIRNQNFNLDDWLGKCLITGKSKNELSEYQIYGHCDGHHLLFSVMPYMISGEVMDDIAGLLSNKTIDELDRFKDDFLGPPPEFKKLFKNTDLVFI